MNKLNTFITAMDAKTGIAYALIRIFLGLALFVRGWMILSNPESILQLGVSHEMFMWSIFVGIAHLIGGILLCVGFFTRLGALVQIPILFSATFFVYANTKLMMGGQSFELATLVLFLLCVFFVFGSGTLSVKAYITNKKA